MWCKKCEQDKIIEKSASYTDYTRSYITCHDNGCLVHELDIKIGNIIGMGFAFFSLMFLLYLLVKGIIWNVKNV